MATTPSGDRTLLLLIALLLLAIFGFMIFETTQKTPEEKIAESVSETLDDIGQAINPAPKTKSP